MFRILLEKQQRQHYTTVHLLHLAFQKIYSQLAIIFFVFIFNFFKNQLWKIMRSEGIQKQIMTIKKKITLFFLNFFCLLKITTNQTERQGPSNTKQVAELLSLVCCTAALTIEENQISDCHLVSIVDYVFIMCDACWWVIFHSLHLAKGQSRTFMIIKMYYY